jgi:RNA polymerase sigma factor FliA
MERKDILVLLAQRMAQLPKVPRKVLAMYYYENMRLPDIAVRLELTELRIQRIHTQAVASRM